MNQKTCPAPQQLSAFVFGTLPEELAAEIGSHLDLCESCEETICQMEVQPNTFFEVLRKQPPKEYALLESDAAIQRVLTNVKRVGVAAVAQPVSVDPSNISSVNLTGDETGEFVTDKRSADSDATEILGYLGSAKTADELGRLGKYRVLRKLGVGGMGMVFEAEDTQLKRMVALKVMRPDLARDSEARKRFLREAQAAAALEHDHIVTVFEADEENAVPYLAMQLLQGESLEDCLKREPTLSLADVLRIAREVAEALAVAHERGLIHRDIKPANIWLEAPKQRVKLLDFGLARSVEGDAALTQSGAILGTPAYMSPEQADGLPVDGRSDLFSLGCVMYRMITGETPFPGKSPLAVLKALATHQPPAVDEINFEVPVPLVRLIQRLMAKNRPDRPPTAKGVTEMVAAFERDPQFLQKRRLRKSNGGGLQDFPTLQKRMSGSLPAKAVPIPKAIPVSPRKRRRLAPMVMAAAAGAVILLGCTLLATALLNSGGGRIGVKKHVIPKDENRSPKVVVPGLASRITAFPGTEGWNIEPDGYWSTYTRIVYDPKSQQLGLQGAHASQSLSFAWDFRKNQMVRPTKALFQQDTLRVFSDDGKYQAEPNGTSIDLYEDGEKYRTIRGFATAPNALAFSPDGKTLASRGKIGAKIALWNLDGKLIKEIEGSSPRWLAWTPDGKKILELDGARKGLRVVDVQSGKIEHSVGGSPVVASQSPDRQFVAMCFSNGSFEVWNADIRKIQFTHKNAEYAARVAWSNDGKKLAFPKNDHSLATCDARTGKVLCTCRGHTLGNTRLAFVADDEALVSASYDKTIRFWNALNGEPLAAFVPFANNEWLAVSADGHYKGSKGIEKHIVYSVKPEGKRIREMSPREFARKYGWKNDPTKVRFLPAKDARLPNVIQERQSRIERKPPSSVSPRAAARG